MNADMNENDNQDLREEVNEMRDLLSTALNSLASDHKDDYETINGRLDAMSKYMEQFSVTLSSAMSQLSVPTPKTKKLNPSNVLSEKVSFSPQRQEDPDPSSDTDEDDKRDEEVIASRATSKSKTSQPAEPLDTSTLDYLLKQNRMLNC